LQHYFVLIDSFIGKNYRWNIRFFLTQIGESMSVFTKFSKAIAGSLGLSFSKSATDNCDPVCRLWDSCYASRIERIYKGLNDKLARHYAIGAIKVVNQAIAQMPNKIVPWFRLSVDGSLPAKNSMHPRQWRIFTKRMKVLIDKMQAQGARIHVPVESMTKARSYRAMLPDVVIRRTSQAKTIGKLIGESDSRSWVVASRIHKGHVSKSEKQANIELAQSAATTIRESGQSAIVCPAIIGSSKCGKCIACADRRVDVVLYPMHP
jgi:hypothetical protein